MDHQHMHHAQMDHGDDMCSMSMLFTWDTTNLCIVFRQWHVRTAPGLVVALVSVVLIAMGYEALRAASRVYKKSIDARAESAPRQNRGEITRRAHLVKSLLYGLQNFYAFMLMLIFMTYNGWVMIAVSLGAFLGYYTFGEAVMATRETACH